MKTKLFSLIMLSLLSANSYAALKCDLRVESKQILKIQTFTKSDRDIDLHYGTCDSTPLAQAAIATCINKLGAEAECKVVSNTKAELINPIAVVPVVGWFWQKDVGSRCEVIVEGRTFTKKDAQVVRGEKCEKIDQCIEDSTIEGNDDELDTLFNLKRNLDC